MLHLPRKGNGLNAPAGDYRFKGLAVASFIRACQYHVPVLVAPVAGRPRFQQALESFDGVQTPQVEQQATSFGQV